MRAHAASTTSRRCRCVDADGRAVGMIHEYDLLNFLIDGQAPADRGGRAAGRSRSQGVVALDTPLARLRDIFDDDNVGGGRRTASRSSASSPRSTSSTSSAGGSREGRSAATSATLHASRPSRSTRASARPDHRRGHDAGLPHLDLRAGRPRRAQGLRVLAHAEPHARRARGLPRGARGRDARARLRLGARRHRRAPPPARRGRPRRLRPTTSTAAPSASSTRSSGATGLDVHATST